MSIHLIVAMTRRRVIGRNGSLPWILPEDLQLFRSLTMGQALIGGRHTYESIGHPLDGRLNLVVSSSSMSVAGIPSCCNLEEALSQAKLSGRDIYCIGGATLYRQMLPLADWLHISWVDDDAAGEVLFPEFDLADWHETGCSDYPGFRHCTYRRKQNGPAIR